MRTSGFDLRSCLRIVGSSVEGPTWSQDLQRTILREIRLASPAPGESDVLVLTRLLHEVLDENHDALSWPVFADGQRCRSLFKGAVTSARIDDFPIFDRLTDDEVVLAANVARWMLNEPQQRSSILVFVDASDVMPERVLARAG